MRSARARAAATLLALSGALTLPASAEAQSTTLVANLDEGGNAASETVTPRAPGGGICARTEAVRDALVARIEAARDCTEVTAAHLARLRGQLRLDDRGISSLKAGDFAGLRKLTEIWLDNNQVTGLPSDMFDGLPALEILQLGGNQLGTLQSDVFNGLPALWFLDLSNNHLTSLSAGAFNGLPALERLLLGGNRLSTLPVDVFDGLSALWFLDLEGTGLSSLPAGVFDGLSALEELNLEANRLSALPAEVFDGLSSLTALTLMANQLTSLPEDVFDGPSSLTTLGLDQNRLNSLPADLFDGLSSLTELTMMGNRLGSLPGDVFDGLSSLYWISLPGNRLTNLPDGVFEGLSALGILEVQDNPVDPIVLTVSLVGVGNNGFKATVPAGAPFTMTLPVNATNGSIDGGVATLTIPVGAVESGPLTVTRTAGATAAVTADIGPSLPAPPTRHLGYALARAAGPSLEVLPELPPALSVADARATEGVDSALVFVVTLDRSASGEVTVSYATSDGTAAAGEDYEAASGTLSFAAGETEKTVEVAVLDDAHDEGEETLAFALSGAAGATIADGEATGTVAPAPGICARTEVVRDAIVARIKSARDCAQVTAAHLAKLARPLELGDQGITSLKAGDFAGLSKLTEIRLDNNQLTSLPSDMFDGLPALEILQLGGNQLGTLQSDVFNGLPALWFLDLSNNHLTSLSAGAFNGLPALERLVLGANPLGALPAEVFGGLSSLWFLDLEQTRLSALPAGVFDGLSALEELNLEANRLSALPVGVFGGLSSLTELILKENQLSSLPAELFEGLSSLTELRLDQNHLSSLPAELFEGLSSLEELFLHANRLTSAGLPPDVFDGLSSLFRLTLRTNQLTTLPDGLFGGLSALTILELYENAVDPMLVTVSLERVGNNGFKATAPPGAPFTMTLPVNVTNGSIDGGVATLTIPVGAVESGPLTVTRTAGATAAVTADIGPSLPAPPTRHLGYALARGPGLPLEVLPELISAPQIDGVPQVGNALEVSFAEPPSGALAYQWLRGSEVIAGATASTYVPTAADVGARLSVRVGNGGDPTTSAATGPVWPTPANPPLADREEELLSATVTLGWHPFPFWVAGYGRVLGESFGEMDVTSFEHGGAAFVIDGFFVNSGGVFGLTTGSTLPDASDLVAYWNGYRISGLEAVTVDGGRLPVLMGPTPQPSTEYSRYADGVSDGVRVAVSLRRAGPPDESPVVTVADARASEGDPVEFTVSLSAASSRQVTVRYATSSGSAVSGTDFTAASGTVTIGANEMSKTVRVSTTDDSLDEENEMFTLTLSNPTNATLGDATATGTIIDDDESSPLTARFEGMPAEHDGQGSFRFRVAFSDGIKISYKTMRDVSFRVTAGDVTGARRVDGRRDLWQITVEPDSDEAVRIDLPETTDCGADGAICTSDGRPLSHALSATVAGPAALSVADAEADEAPGATMRFVVTLDRAADGMVTVNYATGDGTARAGEDYAAAAGTLTFAPGETGKTVSVAVLDDAHDEGEETFTLRLASASGATVADRTGLGTIRNTDPMPKAWLARFGRAASDHAVAAIEGRWRGGAEARPQTHLTIGGRRVENLFDFGRVRDGFNAPAAGPAAADPRLDPESAWGRMDRLKAEAPAGGGIAGSGPAGGSPGLLGGSLAGGPLAGSPPSAPRSVLLNTLGLPDPQGLGDLRQLLMGSSFFYSRPLDELKTVGRARRGRRRSGWLGNWSAWGETAATRFSGADGKLSLSGEVATATLGADSRGGRWHGGVALAYSEGDGVYTHPQATGGAVRSTLTSLHPFARYEVNERTGVWGVLGYGVGGLTLTPDSAVSGSEPGVGSDGPGIETGLKTAMAAFGGRGVLSVRSSRFGAFEFAVVSDALLTNTVSDTVENLMGAAGQTSRLRVLLEGSGSIPLGNGGMLMPTLEAGLRYDGGDAETGSGLEVGAGLGYAAGALAVEVTGRMLLAHQDSDYEEWGFSGSIRYQPRPDGRGLSMNLGSAWGEAQSGVQSLWNRQDASGLVRGAAMHAAQRFQAELGYGFAGRKADALWVPFLGVETAGGGAQSLRLGVRLASGANVEMGLEFGRRDNGRDSGLANGLEGPEHAVQLRGSIRW